MIMEFLENCDAIAVRDIATAERLADATGRLVPLFGDFALPDRPQASTRRAHARTYILGINVSQIAPPWNSYQEHYEDMVVSLASRFLIGSDEQRTIALFTTGTPQDLGPLQRVQQRLAASGSTTTIHPRHLDELENVLDESEIVVATRLHAAIISLARGRPVIGLSPTPKIGNLFESIGLARFFFQIPRATVTDVIRTMGDRVALDRQWDLMDQSRCWQTRRELADRLHQLGMRRMAS
jgi:polysaccharide pyruvyl transferase WcaK-like protein